MIEVWITRVLLLCIVILMIYWIYSFSKKEYFGDKITNKDDKMTIYDDKLFEDVIVYENTQEGLGIERCDNSCTGRCVEYGQTGVAHCFPPKSKYDKKSYSQQNLGKIKYEPNNESKFPNLR